MRDPGNEVGARFREYHEGLNGVVAFTVNG